MWCRGTESNCRHQPFQGCALPTELPRHDTGTHFRKVVDDTAEAVIGSRPIDCIVRSFRERKGAVTHDASHRPANAAVVISRRRFPVVPLQK